MDLNKYIDDNIDDILDNSEDFELLNNHPNIFSKNLISDKLIETNEDNYEEDYIGELYQNKFEKKYLSNNNLDNNSEEEFNKDDGFYYINLINIFIKYYNDKYDKHENFFEGIKNNDKDTSKIMELFFDAVFEYKILNKSLGLDEDESLMNYYFNYEEKDKIKKLFDELDSQIYSLEINNIKIISPSIIICLNYIYENKLIDADWKIFNLKSFN